MFTPLRDILITIAVIFCMSCSSGIDTNLAVIDEGNTTRISYGSLLKSYSRDVRFVPLELTKGSIIGSAEKVVATDDSYYILSRKDGFFKELFRFDKSGHFQNKIGDAGHSKKEYNTISTFFVDDNKVYIVDGDSKKMLCYTPDGKYKSCHHEKGTELRFIHEAVSLGKGLVLMTKGINAWDNTAVQVAKLPNMRIQKIITTDYTYNGLYPYAWHEVAKTDSATYIILPYDKTIYRLNTPDLTLQKLLTVNYLGEIPPLTETDKDAVDNILDKKNIYTIHSIYATNNLLLINFVAGSIIYDISHDHAKFINNEIDIDTLTQYPFAGIQTLCTDGDNFVNVCSAKDALESIRQIEQNTGSNYPPAQTLKGLSEDSNPVLVIFSFDK